MLFEKNIIKIYKQIAFSRCEYDGLAFHFDVSCFENLKQEEYLFKSSLGHELCGYLYYYDNPKENKLVIFDHGYGPGHLAYMKEIECLCKNGYLVLAYDHTGCVKSSGDNINGMAQSLHDLDDCIKSIKNNNKFTHYDLYVIGHSWGGFSTLNITALHPDIKKIVVLAGFVSVRDLINSNFSGILKCYRQAIYDIEKAANPNYINYDGVQTLKNTNSKVLLIYSANDPLCKKAYHYDKLFNELKDNENIAFILEENKGHNPNYTLNAVKYLNLFLKKKAKILKNKKLTQKEKEEFVNSFDFNKMTEQDENIWRLIFNHFN